MNMNIMSHKKTILILIVVIAVFFGYWFLFLSKKDAEQSTAAGQTKSNLKAQGVSTSQYDKDFVSSLLGLSSVNLDVGVLQSKTYQALNYPQVPFVVNYAMESGRSNPFLPIGFEGSTAVQTPTQQVVSPTASTTTPTAPATTNPTTPAVNPVPKKF